MPAADAYWLFFAGSLDGLALEDEPEPDDGLDDAPAPLLEESLDEPELEDDGEDGAGVAGEDGLVLLLELEEPDGEPGLDGVDGVDMLPDELPEVLPAPVVERSAPRSHAVIRLAPSARETATAMDESFMLPP